MQSIIAIHCKYFIIAAMLLTDDIYYRLIYVKIVFWLKYIAVIVEHELIHFTALITKLLTYFLGCAQVLQKSQENRRNGAANNVVKYIGY